MQLAERDDEVSSKDVETRLPPPGPLSAKETEDVKDILSSMLRFVPEERRKLEDITSHAWLNASYADDKSEPWLVAYSPGLELEIRHH